MDTSLRDSIWDALLTAEWNARAWAHVERLYVRMDLWIRLAVALATCSSVMAWVAQQDNPLWKALCGAAALVVTTVLPALRWNGTLSGLAAEKARWAEIRSEYEDILRDVDAGETVEREWKRVRNKDLLAEKQPAKLPRPAYLVERAWKDVCNYRGLEA